MRFSSFVYLCNSALLLFSCAAIAAADTTVWLSNTGGLFTDSTKWSSGMPDSADDSAFFNLGNFTYTVTLPGHTILQGPANYLTGSIGIGPNNVTLAQSTGPIFTASTFTTTSLLMGGSSAVPAVLNTSLSNFSTTTASVGFGTGSPATMNVRSGTFTVSGTSGSGDLVVGDGSFGVLGVQTGATMTFSGTQGNAVIGKSAGVTGVVNVGGSGASWTMPSDDAAADILVGDSGNGAINISAGGSVNDFRTYIANGTGSVGTVTVLGAGASWTNRDRLTVGNGGAGTLSIGGGGQVTDDSSQLGVNLGSSGTVLVDGVGSLWTQVSTLVLGSLASFNGMTAPGAMHITAGAQVNTGGDANVGSNGNGTATIDGSGSKWTVGGSEFVNEKGTVGISNGGQVVTGQAYVDGATTVSGTNSQWISTDLLSIGNHTSLGSTPPVTFGVGSGGNATTSNAFLGDHGAATVTVDGASSTWSTSEQLYIGFDGGGQFFVTHGAHVTSAEAQLGVSHSSLGTMSVSDANSRWTNSGNVAVGVAGTGMLTVANGGVAEVDGLLSVGLRGTVEGNSHVAGNVRNGGTVAPGISADPNAAAVLGTLHIDGDFTQSTNGTLAIQLGSTSTFDTLAITGHAALGGTLHASLFNGFAANVGDSFQVLTATNGISGTFALDFETLTGLHGPFWTLIYSNTSVVLKLVNPVTGDYNHNGVVDTADYVVWRNSVGQTGLSLAADGDGDHDVDADDYAIWRANFGHVAASGSDNNVDSSTVVAVPEPTVDSLLLVLSVAAVCGGKLRMRITP